MVFPEESTSDSIVTSETLTESGNVIIGDSGSSLETEPVLSQSTPSTNTGNLKLPLNKFSLIF